MVNACSETKEVLGTMHAWANEWNRASGGQVQVTPEGGGVAKLSEMSFKKAIRGLVVQAYDIEHETSKLYREGDFERWDGQRWYNNSFDVRDERCLYMLWGIQQRLLAMQFYVDLWRTLFAGENEHWELYENGMAELATLVFVEAKESEDEAGAAARALAGLDLGASKQHCHMQRLLGELRVCCVSDAWAV